jgi:hypothetical protein
MTSQPLHGHLLARPPCALCGAESSSVELVPPGDLPAGWPEWDEATRSMYLKYHDDTRWRFIFTGVVAGNGMGDDVSVETAGRYAAAFRAPLEFDRVHSAGLYDDAGFCGSCKLAYCHRHWSAGDSAGRCPRGHVKSLDPHWHPDF